MKGNCANMIRDDYEYIYIYYSLQKHEYPKYSIVRLPNYNQT